LHGKKKKSGVKHVEREAVSWTKITAGQRGGVHGRGHDGGREVSRKKHRTERAAYSGWTPEGSRSSKNRGTGGGTQKRKIMISSKAKNKERRKGKKARKETASRVMRDTSFWWPSVKDRNRHASASK